jgi:hypothetical protein
MMLYSYHRKLFHLFLFFSISYSIFPGAAAGQAFYGQVIDEVQLQVPFHRQDTIVWCWVACAKMVVESLGEKAPSQCAMLQEVYGFPCCSQPHLCAKGGYIVEIQNLIEQFGYTMSSLSFFGDGFGVFKKLKDTRAPIVAWVDNSHFVVITGMKIVATPMGPLGKVRFHDPMRGRSKNQDWPIFAGRVGAILYVDR